MNFHCVIATSGGIYAIVTKAKGKLAFVQLSLSVGRTLVRKSLPTKAEAFYGEGNSLSDDVL